MKKLVIVAMIALFLSAGIAQAQVAVTVDPGTLTNGFMNVFELDGTTYAFGQPWGPADLTAVWDGGLVTLGPNTIGDPNTYWYNCVDPADEPNCGGPGAPGNKIMEANLYAEPAGFSGQSVTFSGVVTDFSLTGAHTVVAFVKDFAPDFSSFEQQTVPLDATGAFTVTLNTINDPARHVQYGFQMVGVNVWVTDLAPFGTITIGMDGAVATESETWGSIKSTYR